VLRSQRDVQVNVAIMRTFLHLQRNAFDLRRLRRKIDAFEKRQDARFQAVFEAIRQRVKTPIRAKKRIGFHAKIELPAKSLDPVRNKRK
jgi:hypothetical protein